MSNKAKKARNFAALSGGALVVAAPFVTSGVASATGFEVTSLLDDDGTGMTLREAIEAADANPGADTITFQAGLSGTITLNGDALYIDDSVTIQGPGSSLLTIDADGSTAPAFYTRIDGEEGAISISGLTVTGVDGASYAAIVSWGDDLTLTDVVVTGNTGDSAGGVYFSGQYDGDAGTLTIVNCTISGNEGTSYVGGVYIDGGGSAEDYAFVMRDSTVSNNIGGQYGGGLYFNGPVAGDILIVNSTISGNTATYGGGIYIEGTQADADLIIANSTIVGNSATAGTGGGVYISSGLGGTATITNSVISGNTASDAGDDLYSGVDVTANYSLIGDVEPVDAVDGVGNKTGDAMLGALADNGGSTKTHLPQAGSPLIDAGDPAFATGPAAAGYPDTDQRGATRVANGRIDIGAVEVQAAVLPPTGGSNGLMATLGAGLLALGGALHLTGRRKRTA